MDRDHILTAGMSKRTVAVLSLVLVMTIWGSSFAITKTSLSTIPPVLLALLRFAVASVLLLPIAQLRGGTARLQRPIAWSTITLMGLTGVTLYYIGYNVSLYYISASQAVLIQSAIPAVTAFLAFVFLRERLSAKRVAGIGISLIGVALVMIAAAPAGGASHTLLGNVLMAGTTILWAAYTILAKRLAASDQLARPTISWVQPKSRQATSMATALRKSSWVHGMAMRSRCSPERRSPCGNFVHVSGPSDSQSLTLMETDVVRSLQRAPPRIAS